MVSGTSESCVPPATAELKPVMPVAASGSEETIVPASKLAGSAWNWVLPSISLASKRLIRPATWKMTLFWVGELAVPVGSWSPPGRWW